VSTELPHGHGPPLLAGRIRVQAEDFAVEELPAFAPSGSGEHLLLEIEKRGLTTTAAAARIAAWAGVAALAVGFAGMKDRHAVTRQRFSVQLPKRSAPPLAALAADDLRVLGSDWHARKLPRGALVGNRFRLRLRDVVPGAGIDRAAIEARLQRIGAAGVPNYFGEQRFGRGGDNVEQARRMFAGQRVRREQRSLLLSAVRSALFNQVLAARVEDGSWATGTDGEVWMLDGSHSVFGPLPLDEALVARAAGGDIHPTGPLWGRGELRSADRCRQLEIAALAGADELCRGLEAAGLEQARRALRVRPAGLGWQWQDDDALELAFELPPGAYATTLLRELGTLVDSQRADDGAGR
jgi:tRNA pseudouridine13 synthase